MNLQALSPMEEQVYTLWQEGKSNKEIARIEDISLTLVKKYKNQIKTKQRDEVKTAKLELVNSLAPQKTPRAEHVQIQRKDLPNILSPLEYMIFLEMEKSQKSYQLVAKTVKTTGETVKKAVGRIKQKLGPDFSRFFEKRLESEQECWEHCGNCFRLKAKVHNNGSQTIVCQIHGQKTYKSDEPYVCQDYKTYINKKHQERDLLEERLKDPGFLRIAYDRYALGNEPTGPKEMLKLGVNSVSCQDYLLKKRAQQLLTIIQQARYPVVMLTKQDLQKFSYVEEYIDEETLKTRKRTRYPVREFLTSYRIKPLKTEYEYGIDEDSKEYTSYFVFKNLRLYQQLMTVLMQETEVSIPEEGTLQVDFENSVFLNSAYIEKDDGQKDQLIIDLKKTARTHTMAAKYGPGNYKLIMVIGKTDSTCETGNIDEIKSIVKTENYNFTLYYNITIKENQVCDYKQVK